MRLRAPRTPEPAELITVHINLAEDMAPKGPPRRILLLEDRTDFRQVLRDYLVSCSYQVISVNSGIQGVRAVMKGAFDLILCDMMMPETDGRDFLYLAKEDGRNQVAIIQEPLWRIEKKSPSPVSDMRR